MYQQYQRRILMEWRNNEQVMDRAGLNQWKGRWWLCIWRTTPVPRHIELPLPPVVTLMSSVTLPVTPSSVPGPSQFIILSTVSSTFHPLNPIGSGKQVIFFLQLCTYCNHSWHQFHPFLFSTGSPWCTLGKELAKCIWCFNLFIFYLTSFLI